MSIEKLRSGTPQERHDANEMRREYHFRAIVQSHLLDTIQESLEEANFSLEEMKEFATALASLPEEEQRAVLALPYELRGRLFERYRTQIESHALTPAEAVRDILLKNQQRGYTLGYHLSNRKIPKQGEQWDIQGSELDDRDDMQMAYYSEDYLHRYKKKNGKYLYVIRAEILPQGSHKQDLNNHWGRAPYLSVIDELDMDTVERQIDAAVAEENKSAAT